ncbi:MAG: hypothetical protein VB084_13590 [Syntrophomonadaceae bacterium]|nr:hypothetical protein [Syntrophomonadaceae bacterium]
MPFEVWEAQIVENPLWIRLSKYTLVVSRAIREEIESDYIQLSFDKKNKIIKLKGVAADEPGAVKMDKTKINGKGFFEKFSINTDEPTKYEARFDEKEQGWLIKVG